MSFCMFIVAIVPISNNSNLLSKLIHNSLVCCYHKGIMVVTVFFVNHAMVCHVISTVCNVNIVCDYLQTTKFGPTRHCSTITQRRHKDEIFSVAQFKQVKFMRLNISEFLEFVT